MTTRREVNLGILSIAAIAACCSHNEEFSRRLPG